ncbi:MAG: leucine-rich repeat domain-containing protein, partial [Eubacteriales bacterium]|nr:leucine-rich repeat domain-containing protein [Eubacteriales bacterium]
NEFNPCTDFELLDENGNPIDDTYNRVADSSIIIKVSYDYDWIQNNDTNTMTITGFYNNRDEYNIPATIYEKPIKAIGDGINSVAMETDTTVNISSDTVETINANAFNGFNALKSLTIPNVTSIGEGALVGTDLTELNLNGNVVINNNNAGEVFSPKTIVNIARYEDIVTKDVNKDSWIAKSNNSADNTGKVNYWSNLVVLDENNSQIIDIGNKNVNHFVPFEISLGDLKERLKKETGKDYFNFILVETNTPITDDSYMINVSGRTVVKAEVYETYTVTFTDRYDQPIKDVNGNAITLEVVKGNNTLTVDSIKQSLIDNNIECTAFELDLNSNSDITVTGDMSIKVLYDYDWEVENNNITITGIYNNRDRYNIPETIGGKPVKTIGDGTNNSSNKVFKDNTQGSITVLAPSVTSIGVSAFKDCINLTSLVIENVTSIGGEAFVGTGLTQLTLNENVVINNNNAGLVFSPNITVNIARYEDVVTKDKNKGSWNAGKVNYWSNLVVLDENNNQILDIGNENQSANPFDSFEISLGNLKQKLKEDTNKEYFNFILVETNTPITEDSDVINVSGRTVVKAEVYESYTVTFTDRHNQPIKDINGNAITLEVVKGNNTLTVDSIKQALIANKIECTAFELGLNSDITVTGDMSIKVLYDYDWEVKT